MKKLIFIILLLPYFGVSQIPDLLQASLQQNSCPDPYASNVNAQLVTGNALGYCGDEVNSIPSAGGGDNQSNPITATLSSVLSTTIYGDYALEVTATSGSNARDRHYVGVVSGQIYQYSLMVRASVGSSQRWRFSTGTTSTSFTYFSNSSWVEYTGEITTNSTILGLEIYATGYNGAGGAIGDKAEYKLYMKLK